MLSLGSHPERQRGVPGTLRLRYAVADNSRAPHGTLLVLSGGPGQPGVPFIGLVRKAVPTVVRGYRLVMIDQRGTGAGSLDCPDLQRQMGESDTFPVTQAAVGSCARTLRQERNFFTTAHGGQVERVNVGQRVLRRVRSAAKLPSAALRR